MTAVLEEVPNGAYNYIKAFFSCEFFPLLHLIELTLFCSYIIIIVIAFFLQVFKNQKDPKIQSKNGVLYVPASSTRKLTWIFLVENCTFILCFDVNDCGKMHIQIALRLLRQNASNLKWLQWKKDIPVSAMTNVNTT